MASQLSARGVKQVGTKSQVFPKLCFEGSPKVTGESIKTETGSRAVAQKKWLVKRTGLLVLGVLCNLKEKVIEDCGNRGVKWQCFVDSGILKTVKYFPSRPGRVEFNGKASFSMFINAEGKLVMKNEFQREAFQWTIETIAQRD